jgi:hypothetical protein
MFSVRKLPCCIIAKYGMEAVMTISSALSLGLVVIVGMAAISTLANVVILILVRRVRANAICEDEMGEP